MNGPVFRPSQALKFYGHDNAQAADQSILSQMDTAASQAINPKPCHNFACLVPSNELVVPSSFRIKPGDDVCAAHAVG